MTKYAVLFTLTLLVGVACFVWFSPFEEKKTEAEPATDVAVHVGTVMRTTLRAHVTAYGVVKPEPAGESRAASANVAPSVAGVVVAVNCVEGRHVDQGEVLFRLDSRAADVAIDFAARTAERERRLMQIGGTSEQALQNAEQQLESARVQLSLLRVQSPLAGTIVRVNVKPGDAVDLTTVMAEVVDLDRLVVIAGVPSAELYALEVGQHVEVDFEAGGKRVGGVLSFISTQIDPQTGTAESRVKLPGGTSLRPGQFVTIRITTAEHADTLAVPAESVSRTAKGVSVIAVVDGDTARQFPVETGLHEDGLIEVEVNGLQAGMTVVTEGAYGLPEETKVHIVED